MAGSGVDARVVLAVAAGGALGTLGRWSLAQVLPHEVDGWPWATLLVNLSGAFALAALVVVVLAATSPTRYLRPFLGTGVLGGWTTFSTLAVEVDRAWAAGAPGLAVGYLAVTLAAGLGAAVLGWSIATRLTSGRAEHGRDA